MRIVIDPAFSAHAVFIAQLPDRTDAGEGEVVYDKRNRVSRFRHLGLTLMVKRFKKVNVVQQVVYTFFRKTKAERAYRFARLFSERGISTPQRVAYMERRRWGLFTVGYFVSLEAAGTETHLLLREVEHFSPRLARAVAAQVVEMHRQGVLHGDLNLSNFLCQDDGQGSYRFTMIDINRSHFLSGWPTREQCLQNMVRLTHRRDLYEALVADYAELRGWPAGDTVAEALQRLHRFEHRIKL